MSTPLRVVNVARAALGLAAVAALGLAARVAVGLTRRHRLLTELAHPDLRAPVFYVDLPIHLPALRALLRRPLRAGAAAAINGVRHSVAQADVAGRRPVPVHLYEPEGRTGPTGVVYWIHGGGYLFGSPAVSHRFCSRVAADLGVLVVSVGYRLAPEHPFPTPLEDCWTGLRWVHDRADELGIDPSRLAVGGDSAGGGLAAAVVQLAHDRGGTPVGLQLLVYPMLDDRTVLRTDHGRTGLVGWNPRSNQVGWTAYLGQPVDGTAPPYAAAGRRADLTGLPPAWIGVGDIDLFHDEDVEYARRLGEAGVDVELVVVPGMPHGADAVAPDAPVVQAFDGAKLRALWRAIGTDR